MTRQPSRSTLFPYTTLFRSQTTLILAAMSKPIRGVLELAMQLPSGFERFMGGEKFRPLSVERLKEMSEWPAMRSEEHTSELQSLRHLVCRLLLEKKKKKKNN